MNFAVDRTPKSGAVPENRGRLVTLLCVRIRIRHMTFITMNDILRAYVIDCQWGDSSCLFRHNISGPMNYHWHSLMCWFIGSVCGSSALHVRSISISNKQTNKHTNLGLDCHLPLLVMTNLSLPGGSDVTYAETACRSSRASLKMCALETSKFLSSVEFPRRSK